LCFCHHDLPEESGFYPAAERWDRDSSRAAFGEFEMRAAMVNGLGLVVSLLLGCGPGEAIQCSPTEEGVSDLDAWTSMGFAPQELIDALAGDYEAAFDLDGDSETDLFLRISYNGENCSQDTLAVTVDSLFQTANGDFDEAGSTRLVAVTTESASFTLDWEAYGLRGDWQVPDVDEPSDLDDPHLTELRLEVRGSVTAEGTTTGSVEGEATFEGADDDEGWEQEEVEFDVGEWSTS
jgi:hypothetical protein